MTEGAYSPLYVADAQRNLAGMIHYAAVDCQQNPEVFMARFARSEYGRLFETGNPTIVCGMSGIELARIVLNDMGSMPEPPKPSYTQGRSPQYWAGWSLAYYQWRSGRRFRDILAAVPFGEMEAMYPPYHTLDAERFAADVEEKVRRQKELPTNLALLRQAHGFSQAELAKRAGVGLRSIQMYEQRVNDINKAQASTLYRLACTLHASIEDLLEAPSVLES